MKYFAATPTETFAWAMKRVAIVSIRILIPSTLSFILEGFTGKTVS